MDFFFKPLFLKLCFEISKVESIREIADLVIQILQKIWIFKNTVLDCPLL